MLPKSSCHLPIVVTFILLWIQQRHASTDQRAENKAHWCYKNTDTDTCGPTTWPGVCTKGKFQSPIDIIQQDVIGSANDGHHVSLSSLYCSNQRGYYVESNGHSIQLTFTEAAHSPGLYIQAGSAFPHKYAFSQMHLHWGPRKGVGSEHRINGDGYIMEMHIVHKREPKVVNGHDTTTVTQPDEHDPEFAVIGIFFQVAVGHDNMALARIIEAAVTANGTQGRKSYIRHPLNVFALFPENKVAYQYMGSLTTPPCTQSVWWTIFQTPVRISEAQKETLMSLNDMEHKHMTGNFRPPQILYDRKVSYRTLTFPGGCQEKVWRYFERLATWVEP